MTNVCPQCKFPVPREGSRFCNQCGADLRAIDSANLESFETQYTPDDVISPARATAKTFPERPSPEVSAKTTMTSFQDSKSTAPTSLEGQPEATLHILSRDGSVTEHDLTNAETRIGKGPQNDIILLDASVSATHAMISFADGVFTVSDLGSRNGTTVNEVPVNVPRKLQHGDLIKMGHCALTFRLKEAESTLSIQRTVLLDDVPPPPLPPPVPKTVAITEDSLAQGLVASGLVAQAEIDRLRGTGARGRRLARALIEENLVTEIGLRDLMSRTFNIPPVEFGTMEIDAVTATKLSAGFLRDRLACPVIGQQPNHLVLAVADPTDKGTIEEIERSTNRKASLRLALPSEIKAQIDNHFTPRLIGVMPNGEKIEAMLNQPEIEIGKAAHNKLVLADPTVSATHAIALVRDGGYSIVDLGSSNGTFINGKRLAGDAYTLQHGDKIQFGNVVLAFRNPAETNENKTAHLSLEALEEVRRRAAMRSNPAAGISRTDPNSWSTPGPAIPQSQISTAAEDNDAEKADRKKKKKDKNGWNVNAVSRIIAQVMGAIVGGIVTILVAKYALQPAAEKGSGTTGGTSSQSARFINSDSWSSLPGGKFESSGVVQVPGTDLVLMVDDGRSGEVLVMKIDQAGNPVGTPRPIALGATIKNPEGIATDGASFYIVGSQSDPAWGAQNAIARFSFDAQTQTVTRTEVITDFRSFLLGKVPELKGVGEMPGAQGGLNIEGLAWDKLHDRLMLGLRSPIVAAQAVVVSLRLRDPRAEFTADNLQIENPGVVFLSLGGQGIRDITYDSHLKSFLLISGAPENVEKSDFRLWEWDGEALPAKAHEQMVLDAKVKPEGITHATINGRFFLFLVGDASSYLKLDYSEKK
jgi:pSer/pThr/pTyr-binding forkhead associated (FHA) protein